MALDRMELASGCSRTPDFETGSRALDELCGVLECVRAFVYRFRVALIETRVAGAGKTVLS
jgi:hypothetical protein